MRRRLLLAIVTGFPYVTLVVKPFRKIVVLVALLLAVPVLCQGRDLQQIEAAIVVEVANIEAERPFVPDYLLADLWSLSLPELELLSQRVGPTSVVLDKALQKMRSMLEYRDDRLRAGQGILASGCLPATTGGFEYELLQDPENPLATFEDLVARSYAVLLLEVTESRSGYYGSKLARRVVAKVNEVLGRAPPIPRVGDSLEYYQAVYEIRIGDEVICTERPGFEVSQAGDTVLLLVAPPPAHLGPERFLPSLVFPVRDGKVVMQPYSFLSTRSEVGLESLRLELRDVGRVND